LVEEKISMKAIILGATSAIVAVVGIAAPAGATGSLNWGAGGNTAISQHGQVRMGIGPNGAYFEGGTVICFDSHIATGGSLNVGNGNSVNVQPTNVPAANANCNANQVVTNPPANSTVTINGICGDPAEIAKIKAANANLIINSTGACPTTPTPTTQQPTVIVNVNVPAPDVKTASAVTNTGATSDPKGGAAVTELPQTGISPIVPIVAAGLAALTYAGGMAIRSFRARA